MRTHVLVKLVFDLQSTSRARFSGAEVFPHGNRQTMVILSALINVSCESLLASIDLQWFDDFRGLQSFGTEARQHRPKNVRCEREHDASLLNLAVDDHFRGDCGWKADGERHCRVTVGAGRLTVNDKVDSALFATTVVPADSDLVTKDDDVALVRIVGLENIWKETSAISFNSISKST